MTRISSALLKFLIFQSVLLLIGGIALWISCAPFWFLGVEILLGIILIGVSCYGACHRGINGNCAWASLFFFFIAFALAILGLNIASILHTTQTDYILSYSIGQRTEWFNLQCKNVFGLVWNVSENTEKIIHLSIYGINVTNAVVLIIISLNVMWHLRMFINSYGNYYSLHFLFGGVTLICGCIHLAFCAPYFYIAVGIWSSGTIFAAGIYSVYSVNQNRCCMLLFHVFSTLASLVIIGVMIFSFLCWFLPPEVNDGPGLAMPWLQPTCESLPNSRSRNLVRQCQNALKNSIYYQFDQNNAKIEMDRIQNSSIVAMTVAAWCELVFSIMILSKKLIKP